MIHIMLRMMKAGTALAQRIWSYTLGYRVYLLLAIWILLLCYGERWAFTLRIAGCSWLPTSSATTQKIQVKLCSCARLMTIASMKHML